MKTQDDGQLIVLGKLFEAAWKQENETYASLTGFAPSSDEAEILAEAASQHTRTIVNQILSCEAATLAGLRVKARAFSWCRCGDLADEDMGPSSATDMQIVASIIRDLMQPTTSPAIAA